MATNKQGSIKYGELVVLGHNGQLPRGNRGRKRSKFILSQKPQANGVKFSKNYFRSSVTAENCPKTSTYSINYNVSKTRIFVSEYEKDDDTDLFQIGRSGSKAIDFVIMDDSTNPDDPSEARCTISRFACRILVDRKKPYDARIFASGFDDGNKVSLGEASIKWLKEDGTMDGLTTNGVLIAHPKGDFCGGEASYDFWREVSVTGGLYSMRDDRKTRQKGTLIETGDNVLKDGTLINMSGATLMWRSADGLNKSPDKQDVEELVSTINDDFGSTPIEDLLQNFSVTMNRMKIPRKLTSISTDPIAYFYTKCGHVQARQQNSGTQVPTCPACRSNSKSARLCMGLEPAFYVDYGPPTYAFNPCGHMATEKTIKFWASAEIPHGTSSFIAKCPFCAIPLDGWPGYVQLKFSFVLNGIA